MYTSLAQVRESTTQLSTSSTDCASVTEIVLSQNTGDRLTLVLPMLAYLSQNSGNRWFTWITPAAITKRLLASYGFAMNKVRVLHTRQDEDARWLFWEALNHGNSAAVVAHIDYLRDSDFQQLERAAISGNSRGLVLRHR